MDDETPSPAQCLAQMMDRDADQITQTWVEHAERTQPDADPQRRAEMIDHLPEQIRGMARAIATLNRDMGEAASLATQHGEHRWKAGWRLTEVVRDYQLLRLVLMEHIEAAMDESLPLELRLAMHETLDGSIMQAVSEFTQQAQAGLLHDKQQLHEQVTDQAQELRDLAMRLTEAEYRERQRLSRVLHDGLQQYLVAAKMQVDVLGRLEGANKASSYAQKLLEKAINCSRDLTMELNPPVLEEEGLLPALQWLVRHVRQQGLEVSLHMEHEVEPTDPAVHLLLFECIRELLLNVVKHADVNEATVQVSGTQRQLRVEVADRGRGMAPEDQGNGGTGMGLPSLKQRLRLLNGRLHMRSQPGQGTQAVIEIPLRA